MSVARTLSGELIGRGIRVNAVSPGPIVTPLRRRATRSNDQICARAARFGHGPIEERVIAHPGRIHHRLISHDMSSDLGDSGPASAAERERRGQEEGVDAYGPINRGVRRQRDGRCADDADPLALLDLTLLLDRLVSWYGCHLFPQSDFCAAAFSNSVPRKQSPINPMASHATFCPGAWCGCRDAGFVKRNLECGMALRGTVAQGG
jgi:hypothetical protein